MNCYYSNLIEGHDTHPVDIERALKNDYSNDPRQRDLQLEAKRILRFRNGLMQEASRDAQYQSRRSGKYIGVSARVCRKIFYPWRTPIRVSASAWYRESCETGM